MKGNMRVTEHRIILGRPVGTLACRSDPGSLTNYTVYLAYCKQYGAAEDCLLTICGEGPKSDH